MGDLLLGVGLVLAIEGTIYAVFPGPAKAMMQRVREFPERTIRIAGVVALAAGVLVVWLVRG